MGSQSKEEGNFVYKCGGESFMVRAMIMLVWVEHSNGCINDFVAAFERL